MPDTEAEPYWLEDPGHGWLVVPLAMVQRHNIKPSVFSFYSQLRGLAYLEEDDDARPMVEALCKDFKSVSFNVRQIHSFDDYVRRHGLERFEG